MYRPTRPYAAETPDRWGETSLEFFGPPSYIDGGNRSIIQDNFARAAGYQPRWDDWLRNSPTTSAYHVTPEPKPYPLLNFCPLFFAQRSLEEAVQYGTADPQRSYDLRSYDRNQGLIFLHEILHLDAVGRPPIADMMTTWDGEEYSAIGPLHCKYLARNNDGDNVVQTTKNAIYMQKRVGWYPHEPRI
ncbi:hypothetical protein B0H13DRAFT_1883779 [Mycena leptocephala]|nr:hypothetical protein B0H13DRAFT_1883779 [Mycena leptocephala]